jgi:hypothetical protein
MPRKVVPLTALACALPLALPAVTGAATSNAASVIGRTAERGLVELGWKVSSGNVDGVAVEWSCTVDGEKAFYIASKARSGGLRGKIARDGSFSLSIRASYQLRDAEDAEPLGTARITLKGRIRRGANTAGGRYTVKGKGTLRARFTGCDSGREKWSGQGEAT